MMSRSDFFGRLNERGNKKKEYCHHQLNRCMTDPYLNIVDKLPGDTCINNYECLSKNCASTTFSSNLKFCQGKEKDEACSTDKDCNVGLFCDGICKSQLTQNQICKRDNECLNSMICALTGASNLVSDKVCVRYGSVFNGQISDNELACQGTFNDFIWQNENHKMPDKRCF